MTQDEALSALSHPTLEERPVMDVTSSEDIFRYFLTSIGVDAERPGLEDTPRRVVKMYKEMLTPPPFVATTFENDGYDSLVTVRDIPFYSLCEHHLLPFFGVVHVGYLPDGRVLGLSKLAWFVEKHARALQVQERMTTLIADEVVTAMNPRAVGVVIDARHLCMEARGVKKVGATTRTTVLRGDLITNKSLKEEFLLPLYQQR